MSASDRESTEAAAERIVEESEARNRQRVAEFYDRYAEWLSNRGEIAKFASEDSDEQTAARFDRDAELTRWITATPAPAPWFIFYKIEVLEHALGNDGTNWIDNREVVMLAGIKADLLRFAPSERED